MYKGARYVYPEYSHAQHDFDQEYPISGVISFRPPPTFYPQSSSRLRALFVFYMTAVLTLIGFFVVYNVIRRKDGPPLFETDAPPAFGWHYVMFSQWIATLQIVFFVFAIIDLCLRHSPSSESVHAHKDRLFSTVFALTTFVAIAYWPCVFVPRLDSDHPTLRYFAEDLATHLIPTFFLLVELLVSSHRFPTHACHVLRDLLLPLAVYGGWIGFSFLAHARNHAWPLRFQHTYAHDALRLSLVYVGGGLAVCVLFLLGRALSRCMWPERPVSAEHDDDALFGFIDGASAPAAGSRAPGFVDDVPYSAFPDAFGDSPAGSPPDVRASKRDRRY
jgi:hypothetical protein